MSILPKSRCWLRGLGPQIGCGGGMTHTHRRIEGSLDKYSHSPSHKDENFLIYGGEWEIVNQLRKHVDLFAWVPSDMPGIDTKDVRKQKVGEEKRYAIDEEVEKLSNARFITKIKYPPGYPTWSWYERSITNGACALASRIWKLPSLRIHFVAKNWSSNRSIIRLLYIKFHGCLLGI